MINRFTFVSDVFTAGDGALTGLCCELPPPIGLAGCELGIIIDKLGTILFAAPVESTLAFNE